MKRWKWWSSSQTDRLYTGEMLEYKRELYGEVIKALKEWERAYTAFQHAVGEDEVDVAIYTLEAAERRYQIHLKAAKQAKLDWDAFRYGSFFGGNS